MNGIAAPLVYASANAVAAVVPSAVSGGTAQVTVTYQGPNVDAIPGPGRGFGAGDIHAGFSGFGPAAARNQDGSTNTAANPAKAGELISVSVTGLGRTGLPVSVTIDGKIAPAISVETQAPGVALVRVRIPDAVRAGDEVAISLRAGNTSSPEVTLAVK